MALKYGIFESEFLGLDTNNMPMYDRAVDENFLEMYCGGFFTDGIALFVENCFQVISELGNKITVKPGLALIKGKMAYDQLNYTVDLPTSPTTSSRYDRVVLRRDNVAREIKIMFLSGAENAAPVVPALVRTENVHDLCLATILRSPGDTVTQAKITDDRLNTSLCGVIAPKTNVLDTEALFAQFTTVFNEWFNGTREILDSDISANLLSKINDNTADIAVHTTAIAANAADIISLDTRLDLQERVLTTTIPITGWSGSAPYSVAVTVTGLTDSRPDINPIYSTTVATALLQKESWNKISYIDCTANTMTVYCFEEKPTTTINVELVGG